MAETPVGWPEMAAAGSNTIAAAHRIAAPVAAPSSVRLVELRKVGALP